MKNVNKFPQIKNHLKKFGVGLALTALGLQPLVLSVKAQSVKGNGTKTAVIQQYEPAAVQPTKIAPDLNETIESKLYTFERDAMQKVIIQLRSATQLNESFDDSLDAAGKQQLFAEEFRANKAHSAEMRTKLINVQGRLNKSFNNLGLVAAELPLSKIRELMQDESVAYISPDREVSSFGHVADTTGWYNPGISDANDADPTTWLGGGYGSIAVIDSGIDTGHKLLNWTQELANGSKVEYSKDFTGQNITGDPYGTRFARRFFDRR